MDSRTNDHSEDRRIQNTVDSIVLDVRETTRPFLSGTQLQLSQKQNPKTSSSNLQQTIQPNLPNSTMMTKSVMNNFDQPIIVKTKEGISTIDLKGDLRCKRCIYQNQPLCTIEIGSNKNVVALCNHCREKRFKLQFCKPKLEFLEKYFPNDLQIIESKERMKEFDLNVKKSNNSFVKKKRSSTSNSFSSSSTFKSQKGKGKSKMMARKPFIPRPSTSRAEVAVEASSSSTSSTRVMPIRTCRQPEQETNEIETETETETETESDSESESESESETSSSSAATVYPSRISPAPSSIPVSSSVQTQASTNLVINENRTKEIDLISNDIQGVMDIMLQQQRLMCESIKRRIENL